MESRDQCRQLWFFDVLQFVDEEHLSRPGLLRGLTRGFEESLEIVFQVTVIGEAGLRFLIESDLDVVELEPQGSCESGQCLQSPPGQRGGLLDSRQPEQRLPELGSDKCRKRPLFRRLDAQRLNPRGLRILPHPVEEHGLSDAAQPDHDDALGGQSPADALERHPDCFAQLIPPGQLRRRRPGSGCEGVEDRIHAARLYRSICGLGHFANFTKLGITAARPDCDQGPDKSKAALAFGRPPTSSYRLLPCK